MINVLHARPTVKFDVIQPGGFRILSALDQATELCDVDLTITSGTDSHPADDPHAQGIAYDISVAALSSSQLLTLKTCLERILGPAFTVLYECPSQPSDPKLASVAYINPHATGPHVHVQVKKATVFPPLPSTDGVIRA